ncbi:MAG TPA: branched-chain amino acid ABC transporter permease [bacterium]|nr:branched-chain amino acid ABC transporter permease [bacterium]
MSTLFVQVLNTAVYTAVLFLIAGGLSLVYGVMRVVNLAHGNLYMLGAFVMAWAVGGAAAGVVPPLLLLLIPVAGAVVALVGALIEPTLLRPLYNRAEEYQLLLTFGLLLILEDAIKFVFGPTPLSASTLWSAFGPISVLGSIYPAYNLVVIAVGFGSAGLLWAFVYRTKFGVMLRATSQNRKMAVSLGINVRAVYVLAFSIGCLMAGVAGAVIVPVQGAVLGMGIDALVLAFVVVVIGGLGSLEGALAGAAIVAVVRTLAITFFPELELAVLYLIAAAVLVTRPAGIFSRSST